MLDFRYYIVIGQAVIYIIATLFITRRLRSKGRENQQLSGEVSALKFKLWDAELKLKNARDHTELLEHDNAVFLRREIDRIKNRNKPTAEVMQLKADNDSLSERLMKSESERRHLEEKVLALTGKYPTYCDASVSVVVEESAMSFAMHAKCKRLEKELALSCMQIKDLKESNSQLYAKSVEKSDECAAHRRESQMLKRQLEELVTESKRVKDSLFSQATTLRTENYALKMKLSLSPSEDEREQLRTANKELTERLQSVYDSNRNKYEEYKALSDEVRVLKKRVADLLKENVELKDLANSLGACKTHLANVIETLTHDNKRLRESWSNKGNSSNYRGTTF